MDDGRKYRKYRKYILMDDGWKYKKYKMKKFDEKFWQDIVMRHFDQTNWWPLKNFDDL